jgi:hypothetical protein
MGVSGMTRSKFIKVVVQRQSGHVGRPPRLDKISQRIPRSTDVRVTPAIVLSGSHVVVHALDGRISRAHDALPEVVKAMLEVICEIELIWECAHSACNTRVRQKTVKGSSQHGEAMDLMKTRHGKGRIALFASDMFAPP